MKKILILALILPLAFMLSCGKLDPYDYNSSILVSDISRELPSQEILQVPTMGNYLHFTSFTDSTGKLSTMISEVKCLACNNAHQEVLTESNSDEVIALPENMKICGQGTWKNPGYFHLNNFAGKGIRYVAFRSNVNTTTDEPKWIYGWIKIVLATDNINLEVLQSAINLKANEGIMAGQVGNN